MMKGSDIRIQEKKAKLFNEWERFTSNEGESIESYYHCFLKLMNDLKRNKHFPEKIASNLKFLNNLQPEWSRHVTIVHQTKDLHTADYTQLQMQMVGGNGRNQFRQYARKNVRNPAGYNDVIRNQVIQNAVQNPRVQNVRNQNGLIGIQGNSNLVAAHAEGNAAGQNGNQIRPRRRNAAYLQTQLLIAQKEKAGIQVQTEEYDLMAATADLDEIEEVNANCILMANLQQASTSGTQSDSAPVYDSDGSPEVHENYDENCDDNEIFNMFTQEEQYTELLEPIPESHQVPHNDNDVISEDTSVEQGGETIEQHSANFEETRALYDSLYQNLATEVEKVNSVDRKLKETNADLTTELAGFKNQTRCFVISQEKYDKLKRCYQQSVYQEQCLSKKINALHLSTEKKKLKSDFKTREDKLLDKQIQLEKKIKELNNILLKIGQSIQTIHMLSPKPDLFYHTEQIMALGYQNPFYLKQAQEKQQSLYDGKVLLEKHDPPVVHDSKETLQLAQESHEKIKQLNKEIKPANYTKINHLSRVFLTQTALSREELYFSNNSKTTNVSKSISIPNEDFSDVTTPSVARKFLNEVKSTIVTLQRVFKQRMTIETHNWSSSAHQELHKIGAAKFVGDFKSLANEADASLANHKSLELEIERLLKAVTSREEKHVPNTVSASARTKSITISQPPVITKKDVNSDLNGLSSTRVANAKTRRPQPRSNTKHDKVLSASKSSRSKNKEAEVEEHHRNLLLSKNNKHISLACNNIKIDSQDVISKVVCALNLKGVDLLKGDRSTNLYTINLYEMAFALPICLMARASSTKSWLWHQRLSHLNFDAINDLSRNDLIVGLLKFKYHKEHLCPSCEEEKSERASHPPKLYVLVIVDDYSRYTWVHFLRSKDEAPEVIKTFPKRITVLLQSPVVIIIRTNNGTEFKNQVLKEYFDIVGISHQMSSVRTPQQNGVVER
uniref:Integrase catalytic domain-containing protein n=1 Tax=Tanacetum cinerariifolium TaxID=118510 RepID=A0A6L2J3S3_TANCI|nr:hypothetical protein [Tanacetum cinerariifolium]